MPPPSAEAALGPTLKFVGKAEIPSALRASYKPELQGVGPLPAVDEVGQKLRAAREARQVKEAAQEGGEIRASTTVGEVQKLYKDANPRVEPTDPSDPVAVDIADKANQVRTREMDYAEAEATYLEHGFDELTDVQQQILSAEATTYLVATGIDPADPDIISMSENILRDPDLRRSLEQEYADIIARKKPADSESAMSKRLGETQIQALKAKRQKDLMAQKKTFLESQKGSLGKPEDVLPQAGDPGYIPENQRAQLRSQRNSLKAEYDRQVQSKSADKGRLATIKKDLQQINTVLSPYDEADRLTHIHNDLDNQIAQADIELTSLTQEADALHDIYETTRTDIEEQREIKLDSKAQTKARVEKSFRQALKRHFTKAEHQAQNKRAKTIEVEEQKAEVDNNTRLDHAVSQGLGNRWLDVGPGLIDRNVIDMLKNTNFGLLKDIAKGGERFNSWLARANKFFVDSDYYQMIAKANHPEAVIQMLSKADPKLADLLQQHPELMTEAQTLVVQKIIEARATLRPTEPALPEFHKNKLLDKPWMNDAIRNKLVNSPQFRKAAEQVTGLPINEAEVTDADTARIKDQMKRSGIDPTMLIMLLGQAVTAVGQASTEGERQQAA